MTAAEPPIVSILVISYNTRDMTLDALASVVAETTGSAGGAGEGASVIASLGASLGASMGQEAVEPVDAGAEEALQPRVGRAGRRVWQELWDRRAEWRDGYPDRS